MKKVWKKSMASVCAAAVVLTSANVAPAVLNVNAAIFETPTEEGEYYHVREGLDVRLTIQYNGSENSIIVDAVQDTDHLRDENGEAYEANIGTLFDNNKTTGVLCRKVINAWGGDIQEGDYVKVEFKTPINLAGIIFTFASNNDCFGANSYLEYTTDNENWEKLADYTQANLNVASYMKTEEILKNVTAIRLVNGSGKGGQWLTLKEINIIEDKEVVVGEAYPVSKMMYSTGSQETLELKPNGNGEDGKIANAFDGDESTYWHSQYTGVSHTLDDFWVQMNFEEPTVIDAVNYLPRTENNALKGNGYITGYRIKGTTDGETWTELTSGTWDYGDGTNVQTQTAEFEPVELKAVRLEATSTGSAESDTNKNKFANAAEISARVGEIKQVEEESEIKEYSISLEDNIGLNFYADVTEADVEAGAQIKITTPSEDGKTTVENVYSLAEVQKLSNGMYKVSGEVCAAQMTKDVKVELLVGEEVKDEGTVTVKGYAEKRIEYLTEKTDKTSKEEKELTLLKAILNYGAYSQQQFNVDLDKLANDGFTDEEKNVINDVTEISDLPESANPAFTDGTYPVSAISLVLESKTTLRFYLSNAVTNVTLDGESLELKEANTTNGTKVNFVEIEEIEAKNLGSVYTLTMSNGTEEVAVKGSPLHYLNANIDKTDSLGNLSKAVYQYYQSAKDYFEN